MRDGYEDMAMRNGYEEWLCGMATWDGYEGWL